MNYKDSQKNYVNQAGFHGMAWIRVWMIALAKFVNTMFKSWMSSIGMFSGRHIYRCFWHPRWFTGFLQSIVFHNPAGRWFFQSWTVVWKGKWTPTMAWKFWRTSSNITQIWIWSRDLLRVPHIYPRGARFLNHQQQDTQIFGQNAFIFRRRDLKPDFCLRLFLKGMNFPLYECICACIYIHK